MQKRSREDKEDEEEGGDAFSIARGEQEEEEVEVEEVEVEVEEEEAEVKAWILYLLQLEGIEMSQTFQSLDLNLVLPPPFSLVSSHVQHSLPSHPADCVQAVNQEGSLLERSWMTIFYCFALQGDKETEIHISS